MIEKFSVKQINSLIVGTTLACEVSSTTENLRSFIVVSAIGVDKFINTATPSSMKFWLRKYEVPKEYIDNDWDVTDDELINSIHIKGIIGIDDLEDKLKHI